MTAPNRRRLFVLGCCFVAAAVTLGVVNVQNPTAAELSSPSTLLEQQHETDVPRVLRTNDPRSGRLAQEAGHRSVSNSRVSLQLLFVLAILWENFNDNKDSPVRLLKRNRFLCVTLGMDRGCICSERGLRRAIAENQNKSICTDTEFTVSTEIDITGKTFSIGCDSLTSPFCTISGASKTRLFVGSPTLANFFDVTFANGKATAGDGGLVLLTGGKSVFFICRFEKGETNSNGGAIGITGGENRFDSCAFSWNRAGLNGGAISVTGGNNVVVKIIGGGISYNTAGMNGGAISVMDGNILSADTGCSDNKAGMNGGAISVTDGETHSIGNGFFRNEAGAKGGALYIKNAKALLIGIDAYQNSQESGFINDLWIDDDDEPAQGGSFVNCVDKTGYSVTSIYGGTCEVGGPSEKQAFRNTNCVRRIDFNTTTPVSVCGDGF